MYKREIEVDDFGHEIIKFEVKELEIKDIKSAIDFIRLVDESICTSHDYKFNDLEIDGKLLCQKIKELDG